MVLPSLPTLIAVIIKRLTSIAHQLTPWYDEGIFEKKMNYKNAICLIKKNNKITR